MANVAEILLAQIWNAQWLAPELRTTDGRSVRIVYRGVWTHGFGPDFRDAMVDIGGQLCTGDIEIDTLAGSWFEHQHDQNENFQNVILQVVLIDDAPEELRSLQGARIPRLQLSDFLPGPLDTFGESAQMRSLGAIGFDHCAPEVAQDQPEQLIEIWQQRGDRRMHEKVAAVSGWLSVEPASQTLYRLLLDAMGFSRNRAGMAEIANRLQLAHLEPRLWDAGPDERLSRVAAVLLGIAGFLPFSPSDRDVSRLSVRWTGALERFWNEIGIPWHGNVLPQSIWQTARIRPASHPVRRLLAMATLIAGAHDGLVQRYRECLADANPRRALRNWLARQNPYLGDAHAHEVIVNVAVPFGLAYGSESGQDDVADSAAQLWSDLPAGQGNLVTKKTIDQICGGVPVKPGSARAEQGLIHISRNGCTKLRCYECPIAHAALTHTSLRSR